MIYRLLTINCLCLCACTASSSEVAPPRYDPYFPTAVALSPDEKFLFVVNANSDLRYDSGTIQVLDLEAVDAIEPSTCTPDNTLGLPTCAATVLGGPAAFMVTDASVKTGNFAAGLGAQDLGGGRVRLFTTVRGDPSLTWADFDPAARKLSCGGSGQYPRCDEAHRLDTMRNEPELGFLIDEPFSLHVDSALGRVFVTHLTTGHVTLARTPVDGLPVLEDVIAGGDLFRPNAIGQVSAVGIAARTPGDPSSLVYVTSRTEARVATIQVVRAGPQDEWAELRPGPGFFWIPSEDLEATAGGALGDGRGLAFSSDGQRLHVISRSPPMLIVLDTSMGNGGVPRHELLGSVELCAQPASLAVFDRIAYAPCFREGELWAIDTERLTLIDTIPVGTGPSGIVISEARRRAYVANFADHTLAVVDVDPESPTYHRAIVRLGNPARAGAGE